MDASYDVVVLGSGLSGLATALAAHRLGLKALVLEKASLIGGGTCYSSGLVWVGCNHLARAAGMADRPEWVRDYMQFLGGGQQDANMAVFIDDAPRALAFFERCGIAFEVVRSMADHLFRHAPGAVAEGRALAPPLISARELGVWRDRLVRPKSSPYGVTAEELVVGRSGNWPAGLLEARRQQDLCGLGVGLVVHFLKAALAAGVDVRVGQDVRELARSSNGVSGVVLADGKPHRRSRGGHRHGRLRIQSRDGRPLRIGAGLVLVLSGIAARRRHDAGHRVRCRGARHPQPHAAVLGFPMPSGDEGGSEFRLAGIVELCSPHTLVVNRQGRRFADESVFQRMAARLRDYDHETREFLNLPCFLVFDRRFTERFSFGGRPVGDVPDWVARAPTLTELALGLGVDASALERTVRQFNQAAVDGDDPQFGRRGDPRFPDRPSLGTVADPPFFGVELKPAGSGSAGLVTDAHARVMRHGGVPVQNLYAVGNAAAKTEIGVGYQAGLTLASSLTFGLRAAEHIVASKSSPAG